MIIDKSKNYKPEIVTSEDGKQSVDFNAPEYRRSRVSYNIECAVEYFTTFAFADSILAVLLNECGFNAASIGVLTTMSTVASFFQIITAIIVQKIVHKRLFSVLLHTISEAFFVFAYILPFINADKAILTIAMIVAITAGWGLRQIATPVIFNWSNSFVSPKKRGIFQSTKELISLTSGLVISLLMGIVIDAFKAQGNVRGSFAFILFLLIVFSVADFISLMIIENKFGGFKSEIKQGSFKDALKHSFGSHGFRMVLLMTFIYSFAQSVTSGFVGNYKIGTLGMSLTLVQGVNIAQQVLRAVFSRPFGKYSDKKSYVAGFELGLIILIVSYVILIFTNQDTWWLVIAFVLISGLALCGTSGNLSNMAYNYIDSKYFVEGTAFLYTALGIGGILGSLVGSKIVSTIQGESGLGTLEIASLSLNAEQVLSIITSVLLVGVYFFIHFGVRKIKVKLQ